MFISGVPQLVVQIWLIQMQAGCSSTVVEAVYNNIPFKKIRGYMKDFSSRHGR